MVTLHQAPNRTRLKAWIWTLKKLILIRKTALHRQSIIIHRYGTVRDGRSVSMDFGIWKTNVEEVIFFIAIITFNTRVVTRCLFLLTRKLTFFADPLQTLILNNRNRSVCTVRENILNRNRKVNSQILRYLNDSPRNFGNNSSMFGCSYLRLKASGFANQGCGSGLTSIWIQHFSSIRIHNESGSNADPDPDQQQSFGYRYPFFSPYF
jgi:hypothetical protein